MCTRVHLHALRAVLIEEIFVLNFLIFLNFFRAFFFFFGILLIFPQIFECSQQFATFPGL